MAIHIRRKSCRPLMVMLLVFPLVVSTATRADARYWVGGDGNWLNTSNWSTVAGGPGGASVPANGDNARINPNDTVNRIITYEQPASYSLIDVWVNNNGTGTTELVLSQDTLAADSGVIGRTGHGALTLSGGAFTITNILRIGSKTGATGFVTLNGTGSLSAGTWMVGDDGTGTVNQSGGSASATSLILANDLGTGIYNLSGGSLSTSDTTINTGTFTQSGGTHTVTNNLIATGFYNQDNGVLDVSGTLSGSGFIYNGGTLIATAVDGGTFHVDGNVAESLSIGAISNAVVNVSNSQALNLSVIDSGQFNVFGGGSLVANSANGGGFDVIGASTLNVTDLTISDGLSVSADSTLEFSTLTQVSGSISTPLTVGASDIYTYAGGTFDASLANNGQVNLNANFTASGGIVNDGTIDVITSQIAIDGTGLANNATINMAGGILTGAGPLVNNGVINGTGGNLQITGAGGFTNNGTLTMSGGQLTIGSGSANAGVINAAFQNDMIVDAALSNSGTVNLNGGNMSGAAVLTNTGTGALNGNGAVTADVVNNGTVNAQSGNLVLAGSSFNNSGLVKNSVGSNLFVNSATVSHTGSIEVNAAGSVVFSGAVSNTVGETVQMKGGALSTGGLTNDSGGNISGFGSVTGNLTNAGSVDFFGTTSLVGDLNNQTGGHFLVRNDQTLITGLTTNDGTIETLNGEVIFEGGLINNGALLFDPSTITLSSLQVGSSGFLAETGPPGDRFVIQQDFLVDSRENQLWDTNGTIFQFNGGTRDATNPQLLEVTGADLGNVAAGWRDNFMLGVLEIGTSDTYVKLVDGADNSQVCLSGYCEIWTSEALYVGDLILGAGTTLDLGGLNLYVKNDFFDNGGTIINGTVSVSAVPIPATAYLLGSGLLAFASTARRRR